MARSEAPLLLLFDIDGTLLVSNGVGGRLMNEALADLFGSEISCQDVSFSGRTDLEIITEILSRHGIEEAEIPDLVPLALKHYIRHACGRILPSHVTLLPGVRRLLRDMEAAPRVQLGPVTGNAKTSAYFNLEAAGLASLFPFGAFGDDDAGRNRRPALAIDRAWQFNGIRYQGHQVVVIGDSEHDIRCGKYSGAYCIAVATGLTPIELLAAEKPHLLLSDLSDTRAFCHAVMEIR